MNHTQLATYLARVGALIIVLMPFHAFLTVWLSGFIGHYTELRLWKEVLLLVLFMGALALLLTDRKLRQKCKKEWLIPLILIYVLLLIISGVAALGAGTVNGKAFAYGLLLDSRFLVFFAAIWAISQYTDMISRLWKRLLFIPAAIVVGFATLQYTVLPADFLKHFGYGPDTIPATSTIDQKDTYQRVQSTLRGANPLGAYLLVVLSALAALLVKVRNMDSKLVVLYILGGAALVFTYSRSAWLGTLAATVWIIWMSVQSDKTRKAVLIAGSVAVLVFAAVGYSLRDNDRFQNVFFHTDEHSRSSESSNFGHIQALKNGLIDIAAEPFGRGTGTAGPASVYNDQGARIAENYYIQIGQEAGIVGLLLFVGINILVLLRLWQRRRHTLALMLIASFIGITVINMLMHAWTDDTLAYIWWGLAGAAVAIPLVRKQKDEITQ